MKRLHLFFMCLFLAVGLVARGQTWKVQTWFDNETKRTVTYFSQMPANGFRFSVNASSLPEGFHALHAQVSNDNGIPSEPVTAYFFKAPDPTIRVKLWLDTNFRFKVNDYPFPWKVLNEEETSQLTFLQFNEFVSDGIHTLHLAMVDEYEAPYCIETRPFIKLTALANQDKAVVSLFVDGEKRYHGEQTVNNGTIMLDHDASDLPEGIHEMTVAVGDNSGVKMTPVSSYFLKAPSPNLKAMLYVDNTPLTSVMTADQLADLHQINMPPSLESGIHALYLILLNDQGIPTRIESRPFFKLPTNEFGVVTLTIDGEPYYEQKHPAVDNTIMLNLNISRLSKGWHDITAQVNLPDGRVTTVAEDRFYIVNIGGDVNSDGRIDKLDAQEMANYIMGHPSELFNLKAADVNGDDHVNMADIVVIINMIPTTTE